MLTAFVTIGVPGITPPPRSGVGDIMDWLEEVADRSPLVLVWLAAAAIGFLIYFVTIVGLLDTLSE
jgi:hypothetical protein